MNKSRKKNRQIYVFMAPALAVMLVFFMLPVALAIFYSFTNLALTGSKASNLEVIGFANYIKIFKDPAVKDAIVKTLVFTVACVAGQNVLGFAVAYFMQDTKTVFRRIIGPVLLAAWVMPEVVSAICTYSVFTDKGTLNVIIQALGFGKISWLYKYPMLSIILGNIWRGTAYSMMVYQAALDNVPGEVKEASRIDGAGRLQAIGYVELPIIKNTIMTNAMLTTLMTLGSVGFIWIITGGGPGNATTTLPVLMYLKAFKNYDLGYGTAISMVLLLISAVFGIIYTRQSEGD